MIKKIFILFKIARKIALSDAIKIVSKLHDLPLFIKIFFGIFSISFSGKKNENQKSFFLDCVAYGDTAEWLKSVGQGSQIVIEDGEIQHPHAGERALGGHGSALNWRSHHSDGCVQTVYWWPTGT